MEYDAASITINYNIRIKIQHKKDTLFLGHIIKLLFLTITPEDTNKYFRTQ